MLKIMFQKECETNYITTLGGWSKEMNSEQEGYNSEILRAN